MRTRGLTMVVLALAMAIAAVVAVGAQTPVPVKDDPLVRMPGTQPAPEGKVTLESPNRCLNCHGGYNTAVEPAHNWEGSMMAQASRDFLFWACVTVAGQDSISAVGTPNAMDICLRCHFPKGWLEGRSDPPNGSAMTGGDYDGVQCDFCHTSYDPFFETTYTGEREGGDWLGYWDETNSSNTPSQPAADATYAEDTALAADIMLFSDGAKDLPFFQSNLPPANYTESAGGQYFVSSARDKRAPFADANAKHGTLYSRYHKSKTMCAACHDVSNPVLANLGLSGLEDDGSGRLISEQYSAHRYFHVERTYSEFALSAYGQQGGAPGIGPFSPDLYDTSYASNNIAKCQDCHMRDLVGAGADKAGVLIRPNESTEHPKSGQPVHDLTGGNAWVSYVLASAVPGSPNYDSYNDAKLNQGSGVLTLDLDQGQGINPQALLDGVERAKQQLRLAAEIQNPSYNPSNGALSFRIQNQTGHKLISGFPEGRRMFVNIKAFAGGSLIHEVNPYHVEGGTLKGLGYNYQPDPLGLVDPPSALGGNEAYVDELVYEVHPSSSITDEDETFHIALATNRYKDNRIPPQGFRIDEAEERLVQPRWHGADAPDYFTPAEYAGGYDDVSITIATGADYIEINLYYQTTSREYIEFLRDEINGNPAAMTLDPGAYVIQSDPFFAQLKEWGDTIWGLWTHNRNVDGAAPFLMTSTTVGVTPEPCGAPRPNLLSAEAASNQVTLTWSDEHSADPDVVGYTVYYDQSGKSQLLQDVGLQTSYADTGLDNGSEYCYKITSYYAECESDFSSVRCATPSAPGQEVFAGVEDSVQTGRWVTTGKGRNKTTTFEYTDLFAGGDGVAILAHVVDTATGASLANATVTVDIRDASGVAVASLTSGPSDTDGTSEATWQTQSPGKKGSGGTLAGVYTAATTGVSVAGYTWDGLATSVTFVVE